ncbi:MAG: hypothetical protein RLZZ330_809 [Actinomycetota bacterium]
MQGFEDLDLRVARISELDGDDAIELLADIERASRHIESLRHKAHVGIAGLQPRDVTGINNGAVIRDVGLDEIAFAMRWSTEWTRRQVGISRILVGRLPEILQSLSDGLVSSYQAFLAAEGLADAFAKKRFDLNDPDVGGELSEVFVNRISKRILDQNANEFKRTVRRAVAALAPEEFEEAFERACRNRTVKLTHVSEGMAWLNAYLPSVDAEKVWAIVKGAANDLSGEFTEHQKLADAFVAIMCGGEKNSVETEVQVVVGLETLLGLDDEPGVIRSSGELVTISKVLELAESSRLRRIVVEKATGNLIDYGRNTYRPPVALDQKVRARDVMCRAPGCSRSAEKTDLDHTIAWEDGGDTSEKNLVALCRRHHNLKTHLDWNYDLMPDGSVLWITPEGLKYKDPNHPITGSV